LIIESRDETSGTGVLLGDGVLLGVGVLGRLFWSIRCILSDPFSTTASESFLPAFSAELHTTFLATFVAPFFNVFPIAMRVSRTSPEPLCL